MTFEPKKSHFYMALGALCVASLFFFTEEITVPKWFTVFGAVFLLVTAFDQSWEAFKRKGKAGITDLHLEEGGHSTIHPYDIRHAISYDDKGNRIMAFTVFALGGWMFGNMYFEGHGPFIVSPPEYIEDSESAFICKTKLRQVRYEQLPDFVQSELLSLKYFDPKVAKIKNNLYFGMTSAVDGSATPVNRAVEDKFLQNVEEKTALKTIITELHDQLDQLKHKDSKQVILSEAEYERLRRK